MEHPLGATFWRGMHGRRAQRGDMTPIVLGLLKDQPMHGYQIIRTLEVLSHGVWRPSAGSIYPTLQLLEEQELVESREEEGKKVFALTEKGREHVENLQHEPFWKQRREHADKFGTLRETLHKLMRTFRRVMKNANPEQMEEVKRILEDTHARLEQVMNMEK